MTARPYLMVSGSFESGKFMFALVASVGGGEFCVRAGALL